MKKHGAFLVVLCVGLAFAAPSAAEGKRGKAKKMFDKGIAALEDHDYKTALDAFEEAYASSPHWMVLAHIGTCRAKLNEPVEAILALEMYLAEGGDKIDPDEKQAARKLLEEQRKKVGLLHLLVTPSGAEAKIDGDSIGKAPFEKILLKAGPHHIIVIDGDELYERDVDIIAGQEHTLQIPEETAAPAFVPPPPEQAPEPQPQEEQEAAPEPEPEPEWVEQEPPREAKPQEQEVPNGVSTPFFIALGVAGAGVITGGISWGFFTYYTNSEAEFADTLSAPQWAGFSWEETCNSGKLNEDGKPDADGEAGVYFCNTEADRRFFEDSAGYSLIPAIIGSSVFAVAGITAIIFYFNPQWFKSEEEGASLALTPVFNPEQTGLFLTGSF